VRVLSHDAYRVSWRARAGERPTAPTPARTRPWDLGPRLPNRPAGPIVDSAVAPQGHVGDPDW